MDNTCEQKLLPRKVAKSRAAQPRIPFTSKAQERRLFIGGALAETATGTCLTMTF